MQRTPGMYTAINTQTQRTGLPNQNHSIVLITSDAQAPATPTPIYDTATADTVSGANSNAGRMMAAALSVSQGVRVDTVGKSEPSDGSGGDFNPIVCTPTAPMPVNLDMPSGTTNVYAKYRINGGEWQTYTSTTAVANNSDEHLGLIRHPNPPTQNLFAQADGVNKDVLNSFLFPYERNGNGFQWGDSGGNWGDPDYNEDIQFPLPFYIINYEGVDTIFSATATDTAPDSYPSMQALYTTPTTIEFVTSAGTGLDLVAHVFGGDVALSACGYGNWGGV